MGKASQMRVFSDKYLPCNEFFPLIFALYDPKIEPPYEKMIQLGFTTHFK
jgi:hypothetical protein